MVVVHHNNAFHDGIIEVLKERSVQAAVFPAVNAHLNGRAKAGFPTYVHMRNVRVMVFRRCKLEKPEATFRHEPEDRVDVSIVDAVFPPKANILNCSHQITNSGWVHLNSEPIHRAIDIFSRRFCIIISARIIQLAGEEVQVILCPRYKYPGAVPEPPEVQAVVPEAPEPDKIAACGVYNNITHGHSLP